MAETAEQVHARIAELAGNGRLATPPSNDWDNFPWEAVDGAVVPRVLPPPADDPARVGRVGRPAVPGLPRREGRERRLGGRRPGGSSTSGGRAGYPSSSSSSPRCTSTSASSTTSSPPSTGRIADPADPHHRRASTTSRGCHVLTVRRRQRARPHLVRGQDRAAGRRGRVAGRSRVGTTCSLPARRTSGAPTCTRSRPSSRTGAATPAPDPTPLRGY